MMARLPWVFELVLKSNNPIAADIIVFLIILGMGVGGGRGIVVSGVCVVGVLRKL